MRNRGWLVLGVMVVAGSAQAKQSRGVLLQGQIDGFTLSAVGQPDGFLLTDGTEVRVAPYLTRQLGHAIQEGETVRIRGARRAGTQLVIASVVASENMEGEVTLNPLMANVVGTPESPGSGKVIQLLHDSTGQVDGALLDGGLMVRLRPDVLESEKPLFVVGEDISVSGEEFDTAYGRVIAIDAIGPSDGELRPVRQPGFATPPPVS